MREEKKKRKGLKTFGIIVLVLIIILVLILGSIFWYVNNKLSKMQKVDIDENRLRNVSAQAKEQSSRL